MKRMPKLKRFFVLMLAFAFCFLATVSVSATSVQNNDVKETNIVYNQISTRAISGTGGSYVDGYAEFTIDSPGWSLWGNAFIASATVSTADIFVQIINRNGKNCIPGGTVKVSPGETLTQNLNYTNVSGPYTIKLMTSGTGAVTVTLRDGWV